MKETVGYQFPSPTPDQITALQRDYLIVTGKSARSPGVRNLLVICYRMLGPRVVDVIRTIFRARGTAETCSSTSWSLPFRSVRRDGE